MVRKGYRVATVEANLYKKALEVTGAKTLAEALRRLLPKCVQGYSMGGLIFVKATIKTITVENVTYLDIHGLKARLDDAAEFLLNLWTSNPGIGFLALLAFLSGLQSGSFRVLAKPETIKVDHMGYFLLDTGATTTLINTAVLPTEVRRAALAAEKSTEVQTAIDKVKLSRGVARISISGVTVEEPVLIADVPSSPYHLMGVNTLKRLFGDKVLIDFEGSRICRVLEPGYAKSM